MRHSLRRWLIPGVGFVAVVIAILVIHDAIDRASYPLTVWRMDLDDLVANIGIVAAAVAGIWKVKIDADKAGREAEKANRKTVDLERKFNGGLEQAAKTHMQDNEMFESLITRVDRLEQEKTDCESALTELRVWVVERLDQTGNGRAGAREGG